MKAWVIGIAAVALAFVAGGYVYATRIPRSPFDGVASAPTIPAEASAEAVRLADCVACHSVPGGKPFAGGLKMGSPLGAIYSSNITPDKQTGIGGYTLAQFDNAVRRGVARDGRRLYPAMPFPSYAKLSDADVEALYAYFMNRVAPVRQDTPANEIPFPLNLRWPLAFWSGVFAPTTPYANDPAHDAQWNRGAYLVEGPGHCGSCHTPRGIAFQEVALDGSSPRYLSGALLDGWYAPSLRSDDALGLGRWSEQDIVDFLKNGRNRHGIVFGSMTDAYNNSTQFLSDADLASIAKFLKSLPGEAAPQAHRRQIADAASARLYAARCAFCHGRDGKGQGQWLSPLAGATSALIDKPDSMINIVLNGSARVVSGGVPDAYRMPALRNALSDSDIAGVLTYIRASWGNTGTPVAAAQVKAIRDRTNPASAYPIVLQMR